MASPGTNPRVKYTAMTAKSKPADRAIMVSAISRCRRSDLVSIATMLLSTLEGVDGTDDVTQTRFLLEMG